MPFADDRSRRLRLPLARRASADTPPAAIVLPCHEPPAP